MKLQSAHPQIQYMCGHYCELFMCSDGFIIMALDCTTSLVNFCIVKRELLLNWFRLPFPLT